MPRKLYLITWASLFTVVISLPTHNVTVTVPEGYSNHGNFKLFCVRTEWHQVLTFFAINYLAHTVTVRSRTGQKFIHSARGVLLTLAFAASGLLRALSAFWEFTWPTGNGLVKAYHAEALWIVQSNRVGSDVYKNHPAFLRPNKISLARQQSSNSNQAPKVESGFWRKSEQMNIRKWFR